MKKSFVYFMTNKNNTVIYIGVTSDLVKRVYQISTKINRLLRYARNDGKVKL